MGAYRSRVIFRESLLISSPPQLFPLPTPPPPPPPPPRCLPFRVTIDFSLSFSSPAFGTNRFSQICYLAGDALTSHFDRMRPFLSPSGIFHTLSSASAVADSLTFLRGSPYPATFFPSHRLLPPFPRFPARVGFYKASSTRADIFRATFFQPGPRREFPE